MGNRVAALFAGSTDRLWLEQLSDSVDAVDRLQQHEVSDVRIFYPGITEISVTSLATTNAIVASTVVSARSTKTVAFTHLQRYLDSSLLVDSLSEGIALLEDTNIAAECPNVHIATKQGHILTPFWFVVRGDGATSS